jgi:hypothetical protein
VALDWQGVWNENVNKKLKEYYLIGMYGREFLKLLINWETCRVIFSSSARNPLSNIPVTQQEIKIQTVITNTQHDSGFITARRILLKGLFDLIQQADFARGPSHEVCYWCYWSLK